MRVDVNVLVGDHCRLPAGTVKLKPTYLRCVGWKNRLVTFVLWELGADLQPSVPGHSRAQLRHARCIAQQCTLSTVLNYNKLDMSAVLSLCHVQYLHFFIKLQKVSLDTPKCENDPQNGL